MTGLVEGDTSVQEECLVRAIFAQPKAEVPLQPQFIVPRRVALWEGIESLEVNEIMVIDMRFGLSGGDVKKLKETGVELGLRLRNDPYSKERPRQIEAKALRKLRHPARSRKLASFIYLRGDEVAKTVWGVDYVCELPLLFPHTDIPKVTLQDLNLSETTLQELRDRRIISQTGFTYIGGALVPNNEFLTPDKVMLMRALRVSAKEFSKTTLEEFRIGLQTLEETAANTSEKRD